MRPRRVAYVLNVFPKLSETFIASEQAELCRRGVELRTLSLQHPKPGPHHGIIDRARLAERTCYDLEAFRALLKEFKPELLHAHFAREATTAARELAGDLGVPFTFTAHGYDIHRKATAGLRRARCRSKRHGHRLVRECPVHRADLRRAT